MSPLKSSCAAPNPSGIGLWKGFQGKGCDDAEIGGTCTSKSAIEIRMGGLCHGLDRCVWKDDIIGEHVITSPAMTTGEERDAAWKM